MSTKAEAIKVMRDHLRDYKDVNLTSLAENAAISLDHDEWLDNPDHWIWDLAVDEYERIHGPIL